MLSNMSTSSSVRMSGSALKNAGPLVRKPRSSCSSTGAGDAGADIIAAGHAVTVPPAPFGTTSPIAVVAAIPSTIAAGTRRATRTSVSASPARHSAVAPEVKSPWVTNVASLATTMPPFLRPDERDEQPDAAGDGELQRVGDGADDPLANPREREREEDAAVHEHHPERLLPRHPGAEADGVGEERVDAHARRQGQRIVREQRHQRRGGRRAERGHGDERGAIHAGIGEDARVDRQDVGHGGKGREARLEFARRRRPVRGEGEEAFEHQARDERVYP